MGLDGIDAYYQSSQAAEEVKRRLAADAGDADATILRGEILLQEGRRSEAVAAFRRVFELDASPRSRALLRDTLMDGLRTDFAAYRGSAAELEKLLDDDSERTAFLRVMAVGLRSADEPAEALKYYLKLFELDPNLRSFDTIDKSLAMGRDRWLRTQLTELRRGAKGEAAEKIDELVASRLQAAATEGSIEQLQRFWECFGGLPSAASARDTLVRRLNEAGRTMEAELTAAETKSPLRDEENPNAVWPVGKVEVAVKKSNNQPNDVVCNSGVLPGVLQLLGRPSPFFQKSTFFFRNNPKQSDLVVTCRDGIGRDRSSATLSHPDLRHVVLDPSGGYFAARGYADGHLLVTSVGGKLVAVDMLGKESKGVPRVLWIRDFGEAAVGGVLPQDVVKTNPLFQQLRQQSAQIGNMSHFFGVLRHDYFCFQGLCGVMALNPKNGETLWVRQGIPPDSLLFGDDELLFALPPNCDKAVVLRAADGKQLGTCKAPRFFGRQVFPGGDERFENYYNKTWFATIGRNMLLWQTEGNDRVITMTDPWEGRDVWRSRKFAGDSKACMINTEAVGVMEPSGRFVLTSLADGRVIADLKLDAAPKWGGITLLGSGDPYFLLVISTPDEYRTALQGVPTTNNGHVFMPISLGRLYAIDRQGKLQWPAPVAIENQSLLMNGPARLPILTFAVQRVPCLPNKPPDTAHREVSLLCIDKRNGRVAYEKSWKNPGVFNFDIVGNVDKKTVDLTMPQGVITLTFTNKPLPPAADAKVDKSAGSDPPDETITTTLLKTTPKVLESNASPKK